MDRVGPPVDRDVVSGAALLVVAAVYLLGSRGLPAAADAAEPGPAAFPRLLGAALAGLAVVILARGLRRISRRTAESPGRLPLRPLLLMGATVLYVVSFDRLGFVPSTLSYSWIVTVVFRSRRGWHWLLVPALTTAFAYAFFARGLGVLLPGVE